MGRPRVATPLGKGGADSSSELLGGHSPRRLPPRPMNKLYNPCREAKHKIFILVNKIFEYT